MPDTIEALLSVVKAILAVGGIAMLVMFPLMIGIWIFRPVDRAAKDREHPTQFTIIDFFCLFFIIQVSMAVIHWLLGQGQNAQLEFVYILDGFSWFACGALWMKSVQLMSRAGIQIPRHRVLFLAVIIPSTLIAALATPALISFCIRILVNSKSINKDVFSLPVMLTMLAAIPPILYLLAFSTRKIVAAAEPPQALVDVEMVDEVGHY